MRALMRKFIVHPFHLMRTRSATWAVINRRYTGQKVEIDKKCTLASMMEHESASRDTSVIESSYGESDSLVSVSVYRA